MRKGYFLDESLPHAALGKLAGDERKFAVAWWCDCRHATLEEVGRALGVSKQRAAQLRDEGRILLGNERERLRRQARFDASERA